MAKYIKNFVTGYGVHFDVSEKNRRSLNKAQSQWADISSRLKIDESSVVLLCGAKNNGKSSLLRYLLNRYIRTSNQSEDLPNIDSASTEDCQVQDDCFAYYVDFDPGQPEMTTPGLVSAHRINSSAEPLRSPSYLNIMQHKPIAISSVGGTNMSVNPRMYVKNCRFVYDQVRQHQSEQLIKRPIFINTMGHIRNVGLVMLVDLIKICQPTNLIVLNVESDPMRTIYADLSAKALENTRASFYYESSHEPNKLEYTCDIYNLPFALVDSSSMAAKNRTALQLAYFAMIPEALFKPIMKLEPKFLELNAISLHCVSSYPLKENIVLELLYHSWVHLVKLRKPSLNGGTSGGTSANTTCNILDDIGENTFFGCGIVAQVDHEKRRLAIITPLSQDTLDHEIDCVIKPLSIQVPREMI